MSESESENGSEVWRKFLRRHWILVVLFAAAAFLISIGAVLVCLWVVGDAQSIHLVPTALRLWTMGHLVNFLLRLVLWEVLFIGIPTILAAVAGWLWWRRLPGEEKKEYHSFGTRSRATGGGGGVSLVFFIAFCIKVFVDGNWNVPIATWTFDYLVYSLLWTVIWLLIIFGIPAAVGIMLWIGYKMRKKL